MSGPLPPDVNIGIGANAANWTEAGVALFIVGLRMYAQIFVVGNVGIDDYLIVFSWLAAATNTSLISRAIHHGIGRHIMYLEPDQIVLAIKHEILAQPWGIIAPTLARVSFAFFLLKFVGQRKGIKWQLWSVIALQIIVNLATIIQILVQCEHIASLWDRSIPGRCWSPNVQVYFGYVQGGFNCIHDLQLTFLPIAILKDLNMNIRVKIVLIVLMGMSIFSFCASIVKTVMIGNLGSKTDFTYDTVAFILWFTIENYLVIITASVPSLRPLFLSFTRRGTTTGNSSYEMGGAKRSGVSNGYVKQQESRGKWHPSAQESLARSTVQTDIYKYPNDGDASSEENILGFERGDGIKKTTSVSVHYAGKTGGGPGARS